MSDIWKKGFDILNQLLGLLKIMFNRLITYGNALKVLLFN